MGWTGGGEEITDRGRRGGLAMERRRSQIEVGGMERRSQIEVGGMERRSQIEVGGVDWRWRGGDHR